MSNYKDGLTLPSDDIMKERALRIFSKLAEPVDAILIMSGEEPLLDVAFYYATGASAGLFEGCPAILWPDGRVQVLTSKLEETSARASSAEVSVWATAAEREDLLKETLRGVRTVGVNGPGITYGSLKTVEKSVPGVRFVDVGSAVLGARIVKDEREIETIREACNIASRVADQIPSMLVEGTTEYEMGAEIAYQMQRMGASGVSFETIAAFGPGSAEPHYVPGSKKLNKGEPALFDFGCKYRMYCSDITRTYFLGRVPEKFERMYEVVLEAQRRALETVRAGATGTEVDAAAREHIDSTEFKGRLIHSTGHGLGLSVHDGGRMAPNIDLILEENMVMTVEPGVYIPGLGGIRIEDNVRVTRDGCEMLTSAKKELTVV